MGVCADECADESVLMGVCADGSDLMGVCADGSVC